MAKQEHEFGDCRLGSDVVTADDTGLHQAVAGFVAFHLNGAGIALGDVDDDNALLAGIVQASQEPVFTRGIARPVGLEYYGLQPWDGQQGVDDVFTDTREKFQDSDVGI